MSKQGGLPQRSISSFVKLFSKIQELTEPVLLFWKWNVVHKPTNSSIIFKLLQTCCTCSYPSSFKKKFNLFSIDSRIYKWSIVINKRVIKCQSGQKNQRWVSGAYSRLKLLPSRYSRAAMLFLCHQCNWRIDRHPFAIFPNWMAELVFFFCVKKKQVASLQHKTVCLLFAEPVSASLMLRDSLGYEGE